MDSSPSYARIVSPVQALDDIVSQFPSALFLNKINLVIDKSLDRVDTVFQTIREGILPSASFDQLARDHPQLQTFSGDLEGDEHGADRCMNRVDEIFVQKK